MATAKGIRTPGFDRVLNFKPAHQISVNGIGVEAFEVIAL